MSLWEAVYVLPLVSPLCIGYDTHDGSYHVPQPCQDCADGSTYHHGNNDAYKRRPVKLVYVPHEKFFYIHCFTS